MVRRSLDLELERSRSPEEVVVRPLELVRRSPDLESSELSLRTFDLEVVRPFEP